MSRQRIGEASLMLAGGTLATNLLQLVKLMVATAWFGVGTGRMDQYFNALAVPLLVQGTVMAALQAAFIPSYVGHVARGDREGARYLVGATTGLAVVFYSLIAIALYAGAVQIVQVVGGGFAQPEFDATVFTMRVLVLYIVLSGLSDFVGMVYNANQKYFVTAIAPIIEIVASLVYLVVFRAQGVLALPYGLVVGSLAKVLFLGGVARTTQHIELSINKGFLKRAFVPIYAMMAPMMLATFFANCNNVVDQSIASHLGRGVPSGLRFANSLHDVVVKLFVLSIGGALLPFLSQYVEEKRFADLRATMALSVRLVLICLIPIPIAVWLFGAPTIAAVFQRDEFNLQDSVTGGYLWTLLSVSLPFMALTIFAGRALNALRQFHVMWIAALGGVVATAIVKWVLAAHYGIAGIVIGTAVLYAYYYIVYELRIEVIYKRLQVPRPATSSLAGIAVSIVVFAGVASGLAWLASPLLQPMPLMHATDRFVVLGTVAVAMLISGGAYAGILRRFRVDEARMLWTFFARLWRKLARH